MILYVAIIVVVITLTRGLSYWGVYFLSKAEIPLINNIIHLTYVENTGAAFGIFQHNRGMLSAIAILLFLLITYYVAIKRKSFTRDVIFALALIAGGGISNVVDRFTFGFVVDYVYLKFINFAVFNLADTCVVLGTIYIGIKILTAKEQYENNSDSGN